MKSKLQAQLVGHLSLLALLVGCAGNRTPSVVLLYEQVEIGMSRVEVENLLGAPQLPALSARGAFWYLPAPAIESWESPIAFGSIGVVYDDDGRVESKQLNPQVKIR